MKPAAQPRAPAVGGRATTALAEAIVDRFDRALRRALPTGDAFASSGRAPLLAAVQAHLTVGEPIEAMLPGFAFKHPNRAKSIGAMPDLAEHLSFEHLNRFAEQITAVYRPAGAETGWRTVILSDDRVWAALVGADPARARAYHHAVRRMPSARSPHIEWASLDDCLELVGPGEGALMERMARHWDSSAAMAALSDELDALSALEAAGRLHEASAHARDGLQIFARFTRLVLADRTWPAEMSPAERAAAQRAATLRLILRQRAFSNLVKRRWPETIRLSVHAATSGAFKYSIRLHDAGDPAILPYHGAAVLDADGQNPQMMFSADAEALPGGVERVMHSTEPQRPWCLRRLS